LGKLFERLRNSFLNCKSSHSVSNVHGAYQEEALVRDVVLADVAELDSMIGPILAHKKGCQMVYFQTKHPDLGKFWKVLQWFISLQFGQFSRHLVCLMAI
jgi:hypothetical protein